MDAKSILVGALLVAAVRTWIPLLRQPADQGESRPWWRQDRREVIASATTASNWRSALVEAARAKFDTKRRKPIEAGLGARLPPLSLRRPIDQGPRLTARVAGA